MPRRYSQTYVFMDTEARLWRAGPEDYLVMLALTLTNKLNASGQQPPYEFACEKVKCDGMDTHMMTAITPFEK